VLELVDLYLKKRDTLSQIVVQFLRNLAAFFLLYFRQGVVLVSIVRTASIRDIQDRRCSGILKGRHVARIRSGL
jgi:hypothetical protein